MTATMSVPRTTDLVPDSVLGQERTAPKEGKPDIIVWFAGGVALIPTVVSGWGMFGVFRAMGMPFVVSAGTSFFLEGLLVTLALLARRAIQNQRSARVEMAWAWIVSAISGCLSAAHDFVGEGGHMIEPTLMTYISATVRIVAPLAAALMWHRVLVADELDASPMPPLSERRARNAVFEAACAAQDVSVATSDVAREEAAERFRKAWRHAITRSMMHWTPQELTQAGRAWAHVLVVGDDIAGTAQPGALERADPAALAQARRVPDPNEWMGSPGKAPALGGAEGQGAAAGASAGRDGAAGAAGREAEKEVPLVAEAVEEEPGAEPARTAGRHEDDDTMVILVPRIIARAEEDAESDAQAEAAAGAGAATGAAPARPEGAAAAAAAPGAEDADDIADGESDAEAGTETGQDGAAARPESATAVRNRVVATVVAADGTANDLAFALREAGQPVPSIRTCRRLLAQGRMRHERG